MFKKIKETIDSQKKKKQLEKYKELFEGRPKYRPAAKSATRR